MTISRTHNGPNGGSFTINRHGGGNFDIEAQGPRGATFNATRTRGEGHSTFEATLQKADGDTYNAARTREGKNVFSSLFTPTGSATRTVSPGEDGGLEINNQWHNVKGHGYQGHTETTIKAGELNRTRTVTNPEDETSSRQTIIRP